MREARGRGCPLAVRLRRLGALLLAGLTQAIDRLRLLVFVLPLTFDRALEYAFDRGLGAAATAAVAGSAVGLVFFAWGWLVGRSLHWSILEFPATTRAFLHNHPAAVGVISTAIDGFPHTPPEYARLSDGNGPPYEFGSYATCRSLPASWLLAVRRGVKTAFIFGTTAHVGIADISGFSDRAVRRRIVAVATEAALVLAVVAALVSILVSYDVLGVAQGIRDVITDQRILLAAAVVVIVASAIEHYVRRRSVPLPTPD